MIWLFYCIDNCLQYLECITLDEGNKKIKFLNDNHGYFTLNTGDKMPIVQFGTYQMKGEECYEGVASAIKLGYKGLDTASIYDNETQVRIKIFFRPLS